MKHGLTEFDCISMLACEMGKWIRIYGCLNCVSINPNDWLIIISYRTYITDYKCDNDEQIASVSITLDLYQQCMPPFTFSRRSFY